MLTGQVVTLRSGETGLYPTYRSFEGNTNQPPSVTDTFGGTLVKSIINQVNNNSDIAIEFPTVFDAKGSNIGNTKITYRSNISRAVKHDSSFAVTGTAITRWQHTFIQFVGYFYIPSTSPTIYYSGQADLSDITDRHIEAEILIPVPVCDRVLVKRRKYLKRDDSVNESASLTVANSPINAFSQFPVATPTPIDQTGLVTKKTIYEDIDINFIFNVGDLGIYREKKYAYSINETQNYRDSNERARGVLATTIDQPADSNSIIYATYTHIESGAFIKQGFSSYSQYNVVKTKDIGADFSFYKIAYLDKEPITAYPGYCSSSSTSTPEKISNFFLDPSRDSTITIDLYRTQYTNYVSRETATITKSMGQDPKSTINYIRQSYPENEASSVDLVGQYVVYKQTYQNNTYLALCTVNSVSPLFQTNYGNTDTDPDSKFLGEAQCTIVSVKKIKPFGYGNTFGSNPLDAFIFTVNGCAIFQFLDPYKTNLITVENGSTSPDVYLAATVPTIPPPTYKPVVTEKDTQALLFKLNETGFSFVAVVTGDISDSSQEQSPDAAYWIKYWDRPPTASFF